MESPERSQLLSTRNLVEWMCSGWPESQAGIDQSRPASRPTTSVWVKGNIEDPSPVPGGEAAKGTAALVQPGTEQKREGKMGGREKGVRRRLVLV